MFYVVNRNTGEEMYAEGFWAISENGQLLDVVDGWGCEGGGGSNYAPSEAMAVFGSAPKPEQPVIRKEPPKVYSYRCICGGRFTTQSGSASHCQTTKQPGPHIISEV